MREERFYEPKDNGALLGFTIETIGDGGDSTITGQRKGGQLELSIVRPGHAVETRTQPASAETVEQIDAPRLALARHAKVSGVSLDDETLSDSGSVTEPLPDGELVNSGITLKVHRTKTVEEKDHLEVITSIDDQGRVVEVSFGQPPVMMGKAQPETEAKKLEEVDLFALTKVVLDAAPDKDAFAVPGHLVMHVTGLPPAFQKKNPRQSYTTKAGGIVDVDIHTHAPAAHAGRPMSAASTQELKEALASTLQVESDDPQIASLAKKLVGDEPDAWTAAQKLSRWVNANLEKAYGASSDRASDVLMRKKGDCTEHALLFTALARAAGIPARRVDGLVYMQTEDKPALYWHEWAEVWVGEWISIDPTFNEAVADATHLALGEEGRADSAALIGQLAIKLK
jgi:hypothetical protein